MTDDEAKKILSDIKDKLDRRPYLKYELGDRHILVEKPSENGFDVGFYVEEDEFIVGYYGWHEHFGFDEMDRALDCFAFGFSRDCRLKVVSRGKMDYKCILEYLEGGEWKWDSEVGVLFKPFWRFLAFPFWRRKQVRYLQNELQDTETVEKTNL